MKGIVLAGGSGTRLYPITKAISKQLMPIYDKPMIYYPLSVLMLAGINEILIITTPEDQPSFKRLLGDGSELGCRFEYVVQEVPNGLAQAFVLGADFIDGDKSALILGDNIFYGSGLSGLVQESVNIENGARIFAYQVKDPKRYGVVEFDEKGKVLSLEDRLEPSARGEYEITDLNRKYLEMGQLSVGIMQRGTAWLDTGTFDSLADASEFVRVIEKRQDHKIGCIEEVAYRMGYIDKEQLRNIAKPLEKSGYGQYLKGLINEE